MTASRLLARKPRFAGHYRIFPTDPGGLLFEFVREGWDYAIEIHPDGALEIYGVESDGTGETGTDVLDMSSDAFINEFDRVTGGADARRHG